MTHISKLVINVEISQLARGRHTGDRPEDRQQHGPGLDQAARGRSEAPRAGGDHAEPRAGHQVKERTGEKTFKDF